MVTGTGSFVFGQRLTPAMETAIAETAIAWIDQNKPRYEETAKYIWENPELGLAEFKSSAAKLQCGIKGI